MRETPEMVEAVARAISGAPFPSALSLRKARAAIQAMRDAEFRVTDSGGTIHEVRGEPMSVWRFLFDAALAAPEEGREP